MSSLSAAIGEFGVALFKQVLSQNAEDNIFFSPMSIQIALAMVLYGARNDTATQMEKVLHLNEVQSATPGDSTATEPERNAAAGSGCDQPGGIHSQFQALLSQLSKPSKDYDLSMASRLYGAIGFDFRLHYLHCLKELYDAGLEKVDFAKAPEKTRELINSWIESQTQGKIKNFYPPHSLRDDSVLVLTNAVYFKGKWEHRFRTENTKEAPFWVNKNETRNVPMMVQTGNFKIADIEDPPLQVLQLPYKGKDRSMILLLPKDEDFSLEKEGLREQQGWERPLSEAPLKVTADSAEADGPVAVMSFRGNGPERAFRILTGSVAGSGFPTSANQNLQVLLPLRTLKSGPIHQKCTSGQ